MTFPPTVLTASQWRARKAAHEARVDTWLAPHLARRAGGIKHPVHDFLFTYYSYRPGQLRRWHPGWTVVLADATPADFGPGYVSCAGSGLDANGSALNAGGGLIAAGITLGDGAWERRASSARWIAGLLAATAARPAQFGCFGMHEWAMVYRQTTEEVRHNQWPLRLSTADTADVVSANTLRCSHFDAYRFFTEPARPLNLVALTRDGQLANEQPGCLHANMDLYKWAHKLSPLIPSELVADCFALAREIRTLDMRASPYDLADLGFPAVLVETPQGRAQYATEQRGFAARAAELRAALLETPALRYAITGPSPLVVNSHSSPH